MLSVSLNKTFPSFDDCLQVAKSRLFRRDGADVHSDATISLSQAVLGGNIVVPGIYEDVLINVILLS